MVTNRHKEPPQSTSPIEACDVKNQARSAL
jgi:hypothetical protein